MLFYLYRDRLHGWGLFLTGLSLSLLFHHHYLAIFATAPFVTWLGWQSYQSKSYKQLCLLILGYFIPFVPFIIFDLRHPPGLFFTQYFLGRTPHVEQSLGLVDYGYNLMRNYRVFVESVATQSPIQVLVAVLIPLLLVLDFQKNKQHLIWILPSIFALMGGVILNEFHDRYVYPAFGFLLIWLLVQREKIISKLVAQTTITLIIFSSILSLPSTLTETKVNPDIYSFTKSTTYIAETIQRLSLDNSNVAALAGADPAPLAEKYRDIIRLKGGDLRETSEYELSENLFVVSTNTEENVREDESYAMIAFQNAELKEIYEVPDSKWRVYWYGY